MVIEFARNVCGLPQANSTEFDPATPDRVIYKLRELKGIDELGGTMPPGRLSLPVSRKRLRAPGLRDPKRSTARRHRHRYEFNREYEKVLKEHGLRLTGETPDGVYVEICELPGHPWYLLGCQFHIPSSNLNLWSRILFFEPSSARRLNTGEKKTASLRPPVHQEDVLARSSSGRASA